MKHLLSITKYSFLLVLMLVHAQAWSQLSGNLTSTENTHCIPRACTYFGPGILINEIMMSPNTNDGSLWEPNCNTRCGEWIELYNPDICDSVDISCYRLGNNAFDGANYPGGYTIPPGTIVSPSGFVVIRGQNTPAVPANLLVQNGGRTIEIVVTGANSCIGGGFRLWFPNSGGWFAFYDTSGAPLDAVSWANQRNIGDAPCVANIPGCTFNGTLPNYNDIPNANKTYISTANASNHLNRTLRRFPDGGAWQISQPAAPTYGTCNGPCAGSPSACNGTATVNVNGGTPPYTYAWNDSLMQSTQTATGLCGGNYCVTVTDTIGNNAQFCVEVMNFAPPVDAGPDIVICLGDSTTITASGANDFIWDNGLGAGASHTVSPANTAIYTVTGTDMNGCFNTDQVIISINPEITLSPTNIITATCSDANGGASVEVNGGTPPYAYSWTPSGSNSSSISNQVSGNYTVTLTDSNNCIEILEVEIPNICVNLSGGQICPGECFDLIATGSSGTPPLTYTWNPDIGTGVGPHRVCPSKTTNYAVLITDANGQTTNASAVVEVYPVISTKFEASPDEGNAPIIVSFTGEAGGTNYFWSFGDQSSSSEINPHHTYSNSGEYNVMLIFTNSNGCTDTAYHTVYVQPIIPNVFSPNEDEMNNVFRISLKGMSSYSLLIFNRWGQKLFESDHPDEGWNGKTQDGDIVPDGTYFFILNAESLKGKQYDHQGIVTLLR